MERHPYLRLSKTSITSVSICILMGVMSSAFHAFGQQGASAFAGSWAGSKGQYDPDGNSFTLNFTFSLTSSGSYDEVVNLGGLQILHASGNYDAQSSRRSDDPSFTHLITFHPRDTSGRNGGSIVAADQIKLQLTELPIDAETSYSVGRSSLAPCGQLTLKRGSGSSWGLKCQGGGQAATYGTGGNLYETVAFQVPKKQKPEPSPEQIFRGVRNPVEIQIYDESDSTQQRVMRDLAVQHFRRMNTGKREGIYDDLETDFAPEPVLRALYEDLAMKDTYNLARLDQQRAMRTQAMIVYTVHRLGIMLTDKQIDRISEACHKP